MTTENIWETFHSGLRNFILQRVPDEQSADDVLQETFLKIHTRIATLRDEDKLQSWMYQIARHAIADYYRQTVPITRATLKALEQNGEVLRAEVEGWHEPAYILPTDISLIREIEVGRHQPSVTTFLSPFDNLIWHRPRVRALFDFDYRIEMYTPLAKRHRIYGYYVMPILRRGHLIGRLDPKVDRKTRTLIIRNFYLEQDNQLTDELADDLAKAFIEFMAFHRCQSVNIEHAEPASLKTTLLNRINKSVQKNFVG